MLKLWKESDLVWIILCLSCHAFQIMLSKLFMKIIEWNLMTCLLVWHHNHFLWSWAIDSKTGRLSFSGWKRLLMPYVVSTCFQDVVVGITSDVAHEVLQFMCHPGCWFWVALVQWDVLESPPEQCWKMIFNVWKVRQDYWERMCKYNTEDLHMLYSTHAQGGSFRDGW